MAVSFKWVYRTTVLTGTAIALCACANPLNTPKTITINKSLIEAKVKSSMKDYSPTFEQFGLSVQNPTINLYPETGRIGASFDSVFEPPLMKGSYQGKLTISGQPLFKTTSSSIVLKNVSIDEFDANTSNSGPVQMLINQAVGRRLPIDIPIYDVKPDELKYFGREWTPEDIKINSDSLSITFNPTKVAP